MRRDCGRLELLRELVTQDGSLESSSPPTDEDLQRIIEDIARQVGRSYSRGHPWLFDELIGQAFGLVYERVVKFDRKHTSFKAWVSTIIGNIARDMLREFKRDALGHVRTGGALGDGPIPSSLLVYPDTVDSESVADLTGTLLGTLRDSLEALIEPKGSATQIDYHAVLLLELRMALTARIYKSVSVRLSLPDAAFVAVHQLPWSDVDCQRRLGDGFPTIGEVWSGFEKRIEEHADPKLGVKLLVETLAAFGPPADLVSGTRWTQWVKRAKEIARSQVPDDQWRLLYATLLPDRRPKNREDRS